jgi:pentatricopeptide repeat protein
MVCSTALVVGCMNEDLFEDTEAIFKEMEGKDVVAYNAMVEGNSKTEETVEGSLEVFKAMQRARFRPTVSTFCERARGLLTLVVARARRAGALPGIKNGLVFDIKVGSAMVDMYAKCGWVEDGCRIFNQMPERNVITWTSMIDGYGKNGLSEGPPAVR